MTTDAPTAVFNHVAISVPDAAAAVDWYSRHLGLKVMIPLSTTTVDENSSSLITSIYGPELKQMKLAILMAGNDVGVEIFEFVDPPYAGPVGGGEWGPKMYTLGSVFHICFTVPNVAKKVEEIEAGGGKLCGSMTKPGDGQNAAYMQDPWGNIIELLDISIGQLFLGTVRKKLREQQQQQAKH